METVDVAIVGAGFGGIGLGVRLGQSGYDSFAVFDRDEGPGGTWRANTYPGLSCDIPSHLYSFSFAPNPDWTHRYSPQEEILAYLERLVDEHGLRERLRPRTEVRSARFDSDARRWRVDTTAGEVEARVLVAACGQLSNPYVPRFAGLEDFEGPYWHSSRWDHDFDLRGKRVAVVGTGATSIQIVPALAGVAGRLDVFQRSAPYVVPRGDRAYTRAERRALRRFDLLRRLYRAKTFLRQESFIFGFSPGSPLHKPLTRWAQNHFEEQVTDPELRARLTPDYAIGCKRVLISDDYYPAMQRPDVELVSEPIDRFVPEGIRLRDGSVRELDAVVFATGFANAGAGGPDAGRGGGRPHARRAVGGRPARASRDDRGGHAQPVPDLRPQHEPGPQLGAVHAGVPVQLHRRVSRQPAAARPRDPRGAARGDGGVRRPRAAAAARLGLGRRLHVLVQERRRADREQLGSARPAATGWPRGARG